MPIDDLTAQNVTAPWIKQLTQCGTVILWHWIAVASGFGLLFTDVVFTRSVLREMRLLPAVLLVFLALGAGFAGYRLSRCSPKITGFQFAGGSAMFVTTFFIAFGLHQSEGERQGGVVLVAITMSLLVLAGLSASRRLRANGFVRGPQPSYHKHIGASPTVQAEGAPAMPYLAPRHIRPPPRPRGQNVLQFTRLILDRSFVQTTIKVLFWHWTAIILGYCALFTINIIALYIFGHHVPYSEYYFAAVQSVTAFFVGFFLRRRRWATDEMALSAGALLFMVSFPAVIIAFPAHNIQLQALINLFEIPIMLQLGLRTSRRPQFTDRPPIV